VCVCMCKCACKCVCDCVVVSLCTRECICACGCHIMSSATQWRELRRKCNTDARVHRRTHTRQPSCGDAGSTRHYMRARARAPKRHARTHTCTRTSSSACTLYACMRTRVRARACVIVHVCARAHFQANAPVWGFSACMFAPRDDTIMREPFPLCVTCASHARRRACTHAETPARARTPGLVGCKPLLGP
jgi:hypothetical protein